VGISGSLSFGAVHSPGHDQLAGCTGSADESGGDIKRSAFSLQPSVTERLHLMADS